MKRISTAILLAAVSGLGWCVAAPAAMDMFLQLEGLKGESTDTPHTDWIDVTSFQHVVSQPGVSNLTGGARSAGRVDHGDVQVTKLLDRASPKLNLWCCNGQHCAKAVLEFARPSDGKVFYKIELRDVLITRVTVAADKDSADGRPTETVTLNYGRINWTYSPDSGGNVVAGWDVSQNKEL